MSVYECVHVCVCVCRGCLLKEEQICEESKESESKREHAREKDVCVR